MFKRYVYILLIPAFVILTSCGSSENAVPGEFSTVFLTTSITPIDVDADVAAHAKSGDEFCTVTDSILSIPAADTITLSVLSNVYRNGTAQTVPSSAVRILNSTVTFTPQPDPVTGALPPVLGGYVQPLDGVTINPGASLNIPIRVGLQEVKAAYAPTMFCTGLIYRYSVTVVFTATEVATGVTKTFTAAGMTVRFADFASN